MRSTRPKIFLLISGFCFLYLIVALGFSSFVMHWLFFDLPKESPFPGFFRTCRLLFGITGLLFGLIAYWIRRVGCTPFFEKESVLNSLLLIGLFVIPLLYLEIASPSSQMMNKTTIFMKDRELGWKYKPGITGEWGGVSVTINKNGFRGPAIPYHKPAGGLRLLFLGDSITFGYGIKGYQNSFPAQVETILNQKQDKPVTAINCGVGGYSPWQEYIILKKDGLLYDPDLIILTFVLNDVTEKTRLVQFGGRDSGFQISQNVNDWLDYSNFYFFLTRKIIPALVFGIQSRRGAVEKDLQFGQSLVLDADSPKIQAMWDITLANLEKIVTLCQKKDKKLLIAVFPYTFQIVNPKTMNGPQQKVIAFANAHNVPVLDLLPLYAHKFMTEDITMDDLFQDNNHPTALGARAAAEWIAEWYLSS